MKSLSKSLHPLRWQLLTLCLCLAGAGGVSYAAWQFDQATALRARQASQQAEQMQQKAQRMRNEEQDMRDKIARYLALEAQGVIGQERRLDWVELLRAIQLERKLFDLDYELSAQAMIPPDQLPVAASGHDFYVSHMHLRLPMLHEEDLSATLQAISSRASALVRVRNCQIRRSSAPANELQTGLMPQLEAECQLDWITVRPKANA